MSAPSSFLPFRQVHLDFHTSEAIRDVGSRFDKRAFQAALRQGHVNSVTLFSKCHHGWSYHPTRVGKMHPHLERNLLGEQIEACREIGVRCPIYLSAGVDERMAREHPEWVVKNKDGTTYKPLEAGWFKFLRFNSPYLDYLCAQIEEVNELWPDHDGFFLDIIQPRPDYSEESLREMLARGLNPENEVEVKQHAAEVLDRYFERTRAAARAGNPARGLFHNSGNLSIGARRSFEFNSHLELESLPTGGWGWDHFPFTARYAQTLGFDYLGMTGKFHTTWGEFGGFKRPAALHYECASMLALGAKCSIGDQLHPSGEMNPDSYALIGEAYRDVATKEPWCRDVIPVTRIGLVSASRNQEVVRHYEEAARDDEGASRMLLELHLPFAVLDRHADWAPYDVVVLPDTLVLDASLRQRAREYLARGGKIIAAGASPLDDARTAFVLDVGATLVGRSDCDPDYLIAGDLAPCVPVKAPIVIHGAAWDARPAPGTRVVARRALSYFNRSWRHFCSHQHAPEERVSEHPGITLNAAGNIVWFAHDVFTRYRRYGQPLYRDFFKAALELILPGGLPVTTTLPTGGRTSLFDQPAQRRLVAHLLFATPAVRGEKPLEWIPHIEVIEELIPLHDVACTFAVPHPIRSVALVPENRELSFTEKDGRVSFTVPRILGHQMIALNY